MEYLLNLNNWPEGILVKRFFAPRNTTNNNVSSFDKKDNLPLSNINVPKN